MLLILLIFGCNRTTCDSKTLTKLAEAQCEMWMACPEFAPGGPLVDEGYASCVEQMVARKREGCVEITSSPCNGRLVPAKMMDCVKVHRQSMKDCETEPWCEFVDTGYANDGIYQDVSSECIFVDE